MKKIVLITLVGLISTLGMAQTAVNFNCNDCAGNNHNLFNELDAGKVVVISFIMPCATCIAPSLSAYTQVQNYATSHPGRVVFYISDDYGTTSCATLNSWATTNGMSGATTFSNSALVMSQYASNGTGMPKIVVLGGASHTVFFNQNNGLNVTNFNNAINQALAATSILETSTADFQMQLFPNPVINKANLNYTLKENANVNIEVFNTIGEKVKALANERQSEGKHETPIDFESLSNGIYFIKLTIGESFQIIKFSIAR